MGYVHGKLGKKGHEMYSKYATVYVSMQSIVHGK